MRQVICALLLACSAAAFAGELRSFTAGTLAEIKAQQAGRPFILTLWSLSCHHCAKELRTLGKLAAKEKNLRLIIVSTDTPEDEPDIRAALKRYGLDRLDTWVFADVVPERLQRSIDPGWRGELPRSYLFDAAHRTQAHSGLLNQARLTHWAREAQASKGYLSKHGENQ